MVGAGTTPAYLTNILALGLQAPVQLVLRKGRHLLHFHGFSWICIFCVGISCSSWLSRRGVLLLVLTDKCCPPPAAFFLLSAASESWQLEPAWGSCTGTGQEVQESIFDPVGIYLLPWPSSIAECLVEFPFN